MPNIEKFVDIKGYEGYYQISNLGRIKSLGRVVPMKGKSGRKCKERILVQCPNNLGYLVNVLCKGTRKTWKIHHLVAMAFMNIKPDSTRKMHIDHIDNNKLNNKLNNLQVITGRENLSKDRKNKSSKYTGVSWSKSSNKWCSNISIEGVVYHLGRYSEEEKASNVYQYALYMWEKHSKKPNEWSRNS